MIRYGYITCGLICVILGTVGIFLPILPTTPFILLAAFCFAKSSPCLHQWLRETKLFAPIIQNWEESRSIPVKAKAISLFMITIVGAISLISMSHLSLKITVLLILVIPVVIILRIPNTK